MKEAGQNPCNTHFNTCLCTKRNVSEYMIEISQEPKGFHLAKTEEKNKENDTCRARLQI